MGRAPPPFGVAGPRRSRRAAPAGSGRRREQQQRRALWRRRAGRGAGRCVPDRCVRHGHRRGGYPGREAATRRCTRRRWFAGATCSSGPGQGEGCCGGARQGC